MGREEEIKLIAYRIWEEEGCIDGHDCEHWFRAEAIWEQNQKKPVLSRKKSVVESAKTESKQAAKRSTKITGKKRKSKKS
jgi:Protein of unknown function (DUF2934)